MSLIELVLMKYALAPLALCCCIVSIMGLRIVQADLRVLQFAAVNGGKRYTTIARLVQASFLLAMSVVMLVVGLVFWMAPFMSHERSSRVGWVVMSVLLLLKAYSIRRTRLQLDEYYDRIESEKRAHRRITDPPDMEVTHMRESE